MHAVGLADWNDEAEEKFPDSMKDEVLLHWKVQNKSKLSDSFSQLLSER
jgi:hypothetical protein